MNRLSGIVGPAGVTAEYASGGREVARAEFLHYLRRLHARAMQELELVEESLRASPTHSLKIRRAHLRQKLVDIDLRREGPITKESRRAA